MKRSACAVKAPGPYGGMKLCCVDNVCKFG